MNGTRARFRDGVRKRYTACILLYTRCEMLHVGSICGTSVGQLVGPRSHFLLHRYDREPFGYGEDVDDTLNLASKRRDFSRKRMHRRERRRRSENCEGETLRNGGNRVLGPTRVGIAIQDREPIVGVGDRA